MPAKKLQPGKITLASEEIAAASLKGVDAPGAIQPNGRVFIYAAKTGAQMEQWPVDASEHISLGYAAYTKEDAMLLGKEEEPAPEPVKPAMKKAGVLNRPKSKEMNPDK